ncbi:hypothetical protein IFT84_04625 [Rhizobium sp. CFBP 8762]|nr:hypothetical protein [Rhizobium sp. CFBP 8762]
MTGIFDQKQRLVREGHDPVPVRPAHCGENRVKRIFIFGRFSPLLIAENFKAIDS